MELNVEINAELINKEIAEAIAKSAIGKELERVIKSQVEKLSQTYNNPIEGVVSQQINLVLQDCIRTKFADRIRAVVEQKVTEQFTEELLCKLWNSFIAKY